MSARTRSNRSMRPGASSAKKPGGYERRLHHKQVRRLTNIALSQMSEPEAVALPRPHSTRVDIAPEERAEVAGKPYKAKFRVWKTKAWKRRSVERSRKARLYRKSLADA